MSAQWSRLYPRGGVPIGGGAPSQKIEAANAAFMSGVLHIWALRPPIVNSRAVYFPVKRFKKAVTFVYFGASTMVIWRPSIRGSASTLAIGAVSARTR